MLNNSSKKLFLGCAIIFGVFALTLPNISSVDAGIIDDLKNAINEQSKKIQSIDQEINAIQKKVGAVQKERRTLEGDVASLQKTENQLEAEINAALKGVSSAEDKIAALQNDIRQKERTINEYKNSIAEAVRTLSANDDITLVEVFLAKGTLSDFWSRADTLNQFNVSVGEKTADLEKLKVGLNREVAEERAEQAKLLALRSEIEGKKEAVEYARGEKNKLIASARGEEKTYQATLAEKRKLRAAFEQNLNQFESRLNIALNPASIPVAQSSTLIMPMGGVITQEFGYTAFAAGGAYGGKGHNGMDIGAPVGTPVKAARGGVVKGTGNTDAACARASYGKWILIEHDNGLSTLYAHLSVISVNPGQTVTGGQAIGYSGNTGYSTGPHLHFTVYATDGVRIQGLPSSSCPGATFTLPVANPQAYLNPRKYLP